jgi:peptidyl-tRNA hydrolase, PTH1 family
MKLIVGLGNPGSEYEKTRHNVGFRLVNLLGRRWDISLKRRKFQGRCGDGMFVSERVVLLKPETYMNRSGGSVVEASQFFKVSASEILVVVDDMNLELGRLRLRGSGSAGGHNGLKSIIGWLGSEEFSRLRIGIGQASHEDSVGHVLGKFGSDEEATIESSLAQAADCVECFVQEGLDAAMSRYNASE